MLIPILEDLSLSSLQYILLSSSINCESKVLIFECTNSKVVVLIVIQTRFTLYSTSKPCISLKKAT